jgi:hypothetical protein
MFESGEHFTSSFVTKFSPLKVTFTNPPCPTTHCTNGLIEVSWICVDVTVTTNAGEEIAVFSVEVATTLAEPAVADASTPAVVIVPRLVAQVANPVFVVPLLYKVVAVHCDVDVGVVVIVAGTQTTEIDVTVTATGLIVMATVLTLLESCVDVAVMVTGVTTEIVDDAVNVTGVPEATFAVALSVPAFAGLTERFDVLA